MPKKILMVCLGNICRSPLAEGLLRKMAEEKGLEIELDSAGMESFHVGEAPDPRTQKNARSHGLDISSLRARQFCVEDFDRFDKIFVMDRFILAEMLTLTRNEDDKKKVELILNRLYPGQNRHVPDPYLGGESGFEEVYQMLSNACQRIIENIAEDKL